MSLFGTLSPRFRDRVAHALRPGWTRSLLIRRCVAVALVVTAVVVGISGSRSDGERLALVAAHDLMPGHVMGAADVELRAITGPLLPDAALADADAVAGRTVTSRVRRGEILTDTRLLSSRLPSDLTGRADARLVPVTLSDDAVTSLLRPGDVVDVLTEDAEVLARRAVVALHAADAQSGGITASRTGARPVLLAMDAGSALRVAAAGLDTSLAVVLH